jgi:hypothetical protein
VLAQKSYSLVWDDQFRNEDACNYEYHQRTSRRSDRVSSCLEATYPSTTLLHVFLERIRLKTTLETSVDGQGFVTSAVESPTEHHIVAHAGLEKTTNLFPGGTAEDEATTWTPCSIEDILAQLVLLVLDCKILVQSIVERNVVEVLEGSRQHQPYISILTNIPEGV